MHIGFIDYLIIGGFLLVILGIGLYTSRSASKNTSEFFLSGRSMPWWLLGFSMVATTFSTDTPNLVTDIVRDQGVAGNWVWWAFLLTGLLTVFVFARLWRKSGVDTDMGFYQLRYSGKAASFLHEFRAVYLGLIFNVLAMSGVTLAAIKIGQVMLGISPVTVVVVAGLVTVFFSALGGFKGVIYTDFILFIAAMAGSIGAAYFIVNQPDIGGLQALITHENVAPKLGMLPDFSDTESLILLLIIPLAIQWWSTWYPGAEPGGGGYVAQRMLAAKDESHAVGATFFFNIMHYAFRPWPWILVALASLIRYPDIASISAAFPAVEASKLGNDLAYSAMLTQLPTGLLGLVLASLGAAYISTLSSHLNWGASYLVYDVYAKHRPEASEKTKVRMGQLATLLLMAVSGFVALQLQNAKQLFDVILMFGAGTGLLFMMRWFWWRINAWSEISAMIISGVVSMLLAFTSVGPMLFGSEGLMPGYMQYPFIVLVTTATWVAVTFMTPAENPETLKKFVDQLELSGPGWKAITDRKSSGFLSRGILSMLYGCVLVYGMLFAVGQLLYQKYSQAALLFVVAVAAGIALRQAVKKTSFS
ncbi:MAG: sodium:solute symporter family protein [Flavobacteriaceae bacterium]